MEPFAARNVFPESFPHSPFPSVSPPPLSFRFPPKLLVFFSLLSPSWYDPSIRAVRGGDGEIFGFGQDSWESEILGKLEF